MPPLNRREVLRLGAAGVGSLAVGTESFAATAACVHFSIHHDHLLGTSFDAWFLAGDAADADQAERIALDEIERLRRIFSLHDPLSELSRLNQSSGFVEVSPDLLTALRHYEHWTELSAGACNAGIGSMTRLWEESARQGIAPRAERLDAMARRINSPVFSIEGNRVRLATDQNLNLNSVAKGYVLQRVAGEIQARLPAIRAGLVNLGGDILAWGDCDWVVGIQNPDAPADNAEPLTRVQLRNTAIATSGGYLRHHAIDGVRHSHIIDPRTGLAAAGVAGATVIARDSVTANVLATTLCVLGAGEGLKLAAGLPGVECLLVEEFGRVVRSAGFASQEISAAETQEPTEKKDPKPAEKKDSKKGADWPEEFEVNVNLELPTPMGGRARRPYVAMWIEDADGKAVRTVSVWGMSPKWINTLSGWWKIGKDNRELVKAVSRATRSPGKYTVVWDGKDDAGKALPQGTYTIKVEVHREHGKDVTQSGKFDCLTAPATLKLAKNAETQETTVSYAKKEKKDKK